MDSGSTHKVRLVRCPKCRQLLPEPADVEVYKCGGCSTVLQVKNRKNDAKSTTSGSRESKNAHLNALHCVYEVGECSSSSPKAILPSSAERSLDQNSGRDEKISTDCCTENSGDVNSSDNQNNEKDHNESQVCDSHIKQPGTSNEFGSSNGDANHENEVLSQLATDNSEVELNDMNSDWAGENLAADINCENDSTFRSSNTDNMARREDDSAVACHRQAAESISSNILISSPDELLAVDINHGRDSTFRSSNTDNMLRGENDSTVTYHRQAAESISSDILMSSPDEQPKQLQMSVNLSYERRDFFSPRSDFSSKTEYSKSKSPTMRSSHDYDGSVSSFDGTDDQFPDQHMNLHKNTFKKLNSVISEEQSRRDKFLGNGTMNGNSEMQHQAWNLSSAFTGKRPNTKDYKGATGHDLMVSNGARLWDDEFPSSLHFYRRDYSAGYESASTSSQLQDELHHCSSETEKIKLLRMVYELQDQLTKTCHVNEKAHTGISSGVIGKGKYIPSHYSCEIPEDEFSHELNYHRYPERFRQVSNWPHQHNKVSRIPFSGEATNNSHHINSSRMQRYPKEWQCSAQLPPPFLSHNKGFCRFHPGQSCLHSYSSCPSSPQHFKDSEFPIWSRETKSDDQRRGDYRMKKYKEKHHLAKRHLRPTAGAAPFVTCYRCLRPLQLPADFLVFRKRFHLLRCGGCSEVLKFSLEKRTHIVPYTPQAVALQPNQLDEDNDAINTRNSISSSRGNDYSPADPVSCSDDYGLSYCRSCSTDGDPVILASFHNHQGNKDARNMSYDSSESMKERSQFVLKQSGNRFKTSVGTKESAGASSIKYKSGRASSEIEEVSVKTCSPLHQLMGYSSPSQVLRGSDPSRTSSNCP